MSKTVAFTTDTALPCCNRYEPTVILCLAESGLLSQKNCPDESPDTFDYLTLEATLVSSTRQVNDCGQVIGYQYVVRYDETLLADPDTALTAEQIDGVFCKGCRETWVEDVVGDEPALVSNGDGSITWTSPHGCTLTFVPGTAACFSDTSTVEIGLDGDGCLQGTVVLSPTAGNIIQALGNGLFIPQDVNYDFLPHVDATFDLGSSAKEWVTTYTNNVESQDDLNLKAINEINFYRNGILIALFDSDAFIPNSDVSRDLGDPTHQWREVYGQSFNYASGPLIINSTTDDIHFYRNNVFAVYIDADTMSPNSDVFRSLGDPTHQWKEVYAQSFNYASGPLIINSTTDDIHFYRNNTFVAYIDATSFSPNSNGFRDLGSSSKQWKEIHAQSLNYAGAALIIHATAGAVRFHTSGSHRGSFNSSGDFEVGPTGSVKFTVLQTNGQVKTVAANETTGGGNAAFGAANCPAVTATAVNTWLKFTKSDGSQLYIPAWK